MHGALTNEPASSLLGPGALSWGASSLTAIRCCLSGRGSRSQESPRAQTSSLVCFFHLTGKHSSFLSLSHTHTHTHLPSPPLPPTPTPSQQTSGHVCRSTWKKPLIKLVNASSGPRGDIPCTPPHARGPGTLGWAADSTCSSCHSVAPR